jgi:hypothetical protein
MLWLMQVVSSLNHLFFLRQSMLRLQGIRLVLSMQGQMQQQQQGQMQQQQQGQMQ